MKWTLFEKKKPNIGDRMLVKTLSGQIFYAIYSNDDEFDVHRNDGENMRESWYKYSSRTVIFWRYFA